MWNVLIRKLKKKSRKIGLKLKFQIYLNQIFKFQIVIKKSFWFLFSLNLLILIEQISFDFYLFWICIDSIFYFISEHTDVTDNFFKLKKYWISTKNIQEITKIINDDDQIKKNKKYIFDKKM